MYPEKILNYVLKMNFLVSKLHQIIVVNTKIVTLTLDLLIHEHAFYF